MPVRRRRESVSLRIHLDSAATCEGLSQHAPVLFEQRRKGVAVLLQQPGRAFDVGEEEGDGAGGKLGQASVLRLARLAVLAAMPEVLEGLPDRDHGDEDQPDDSHGDHDPLALFVRGDDLEQQPEHRAGL